MSLFKRPPVLLPPAAKSGACAGPSSASRSPSEAGALLAHARRPSLLCRRAASRGFTYQQSDWR